MDYQLREYAIDPVPPTPYARWRSWTLHPLTLTAFLLVDVAVFVTVGILVAISNTHSGFATVQSDTPLLFGSSMDLQLLWTTLPNFVSRLLGIFLDAIIIAAADQEPFVELHKEEGTTAKRSILLDYRTKAAPLRWIVALSNGHFLLGLGLLLCILLSLLVTPLSAHLFVQRPTSYTSNISLVIPNPFDESAINSTTQWSSIFDQVAATRIYNGKPVPWTNEEYAFPPVLLTEALLSKSTNMNVTLNTTAYSAYMDCKNLHGYQTELSDTNSDRSEGHIYITGNDRGCSVAQDFAVASIQEEYFKTTSKVDCSASSFYSRLLFTAGIFSNSSQYLLKNTSFISCITGYRTTPGFLTISLGADSTPTVLTFTPNGSPDETRPGLWRALEPGILGPTDFTPNVKWSTSGFGRLILVSASKANPSQYLDSENLINSMQTMFNAVYLTAVATYSFKTDFSPYNVLGLTSQMTMRLIVVPWVAYAIIVILVACLVNVIWVWMHTQRHRSILSEEPSGIFSYAGLLYGSNILALSNEICEADRFDGRVRKSARRRRGLDEATCSITLRGQHPVINVQV